MSRGVITRMKMLREDAVDDHDVAEDEVEDAEVEDDDVKG